MIEDPKGSLWFGVNGGVYYFNGTSWKFYPFTNEPSDIAVVSLCVASDGYLYAGTTKGISRLKNGKWELLDIKLGLGDPVEHPFNKIPILEAYDRSIWIGTHQGAIRLKDGQMILYREDGSFYNLNKKEVIEQVKRLASFDIYCIHQDNSGKIWFGLRDGRIFNGQFNNNSFAWHRVDNEPGYVRTKFPLIKTTSSGSIFIASGQNDGGINISNGHKWKLFKSKPLYGIDDLYSDIIELKDGSVCVAGVGRLLVYKSGSWKMYESSNYPFSSNRLILYESKNQNLFIIGLGNEVWRIDLSYNNWAALKGLSFQTEDKNGDKWFISVDGMVIRCDSKMNKWTRYSKKDGVIDVPVVILASRNGVIWVAGSDNQTAATACFDGKQWRKQIHPKLGWGIERRAAFEAMDGSLWFGSSSDIFTEKGQLGGLVRYMNVGQLDNIRYEYYYADNNFSLTGIYGIGETSDHSIWVGQLGFYRLALNSHKWTRIVDPSGLNASFVDCIQTSSTGDLWVGTRTNGVYFLNSKTNKWNHYTVSDGLSSNTIVNILVISNQNVWVATNRDISHFDGKNWSRNSFHSFLRPKMDGISIKSTKDGGIWVQQNLPAWYRKALYRDSFSGDSYDDFITTRYYPDKLPPKTIITFSQERIAQPGNVILSWTANDPWKLTPTDQIQYSYRIDDNEWSAYTYKTSDIFLSLPSGYHTFEVKARDRDMNVDPMPAKVQFYVVRPIWAQPWFIILILTFLAIIAYFIKHLYARNIIIAEMSETKVRLFANISHELRTPLTLIIGPLLKVLESPLLDDELKKPLSLVNRNCHRLLRLVNQVLDFTKMEAGQLSFAPKKGDIIDFLKEEVAVFEERAETKKIHLEIKTEISRLETWFDPDKIEKIMFNLLSNALKFTPQNGSVKVFIAGIETGKIKTLDLGLQRPVKVSNWLEITIKDTGVGIAQKNLEKIFKNFYQVKDHLKTAVGGTGIGLSVTKDMVEKHGGKIRVESTEGVGTAFIVKIPIITEELFDGVDESDLINRSQFISSKFPENEVELIETASSSAKNGEENKNKPKVLVVEDNTDMRHYIKGELENEFDIIEAINGQDALEKALNCNPEIILSDIMMPQMDGIELCKKIKTNEMTSHIAVVLLTARSSQEYKMEGLETGADDYLTKPFYGAELLLRIRNIIETRTKLRKKLGKALVEIEPNSIEITSVDQKFLKRAIDIIEEHMDDSEFNVETFSKLIGMSRVSLYNKLKSLTDHSVQEFVFAIRLKRAAQLIKESGMTITEISYSVGFKDPSHFSKLFKKQFGVPPKAFLKKEEN
ncbi:MAG: response regulator [Bacteroidota bacterium]|nr:response regulator [Bacteroidota bacterium]